MAATQVRVGNFMGTGVDLLPLPRTPGWRSVDWQLTTSTGENVSPYTRTEQILAWPGAEWWAATVTMPPMNRMDGAQWTAVLMGLRGRQHAFQISDQLYALGIPPDPLSTAPPFNAYAPLSPQGSSGATPVVALVSPVTNAPGTVALGSGGWMPNTPQVLSRGDKIQVGYRYYSVMADVASDGNGNAIIITAPGLREMPTAGTPIDIINPACLMRLDSSSLKWSTDSDGITHLSFGCIEVR